MPLYICLSATLPDQTLEMLMGLVRSARSRSLSILHPSFNLSKRLREGLRRILPDNAHQLLSGKLCISLTRVSDGKNVLVSDFRSKEEVLDVSSLLIGVLSSRKGCFVLKATQRGLSQATCPVPGCLRCWFASYQSAINLVWIW